MEPRTKRLLAFFLGCVVVRVGFVLVARFVPPRALPYLGGLALLPAAGFMYLYATDGVGTGHSIFRGELWWAQLRPVHACLYLAFALMAFRKLELSWVPLAVDVTVGAVAAAVYYARFNDEESISRMHERLASHEESASR